ncbi:MAG: hypothetical protein ABEJ05_01685 [Haloglomus sp.]
MAGETPIYATLGLVTALLDIAEDRSPSDVTVALATMAAGEFEPPLDLPPETPVFTDLYLPETGGSVAAVFGMDLGTPASDGRFVSHPDGRLEVRQTDDLHEVVFVGVPPWDRASIAAFDRRGRGRPLELLDVEPPAESLPS